MDRFFLTRRKDANQPLANNSEQKRFPMFLSSGEVIYPKGDSKKRNGEISEKPFEKAEKIETVKRFERIIEGSVYINLATSTKNGTPWSSVLYTAYDEEYNFYWASSPRSKHSQYMLDNNKVSFTICYATAKGPCEVAYIQAKAWPLTNKKEIEDVLRCFSARMVNVPEDRNQPAEDFLGDSVKKIYKAKPEKFSINEPQYVFGHSFDKPIEVDDFLLRGLQTQTYDTSQMGYGLYRPAQLQNPWLLATGGFPSADVPTQERHPKSGTLSSDLSQPATGSLAATPKEDTGMHKRITSMLQKQGEMVKRVMQSDVIKETPLKKVKRIIEGITSINLATSTKNGTPWSNWLDFAYDKKYHIYWFSPPDAEHSINIGPYNKVSFTIYDYHAPQGTGEGVYIQAKAWPLTDEKEIENALRCFSARKKETTKYTAKDFLGDSIKVYKAEPEKFSINGYEYIDGWILDKPIEVDNFLGQGRRHDRIMQTLQKRGDEVSQRFKNYRGLE